MSVPLAAVRLSLRPPTQERGTYGGFRLSDGFISPLDLVEIGLLSRAEAEELHAMETAAK